MTVVIAYVIEIFLNQLADLSQDKLYDEYDNMHDEFHKFLDTPKVKVSSVSHSWHWIKTILKLNSNKELLEREQRGHLQDIFESRKHIGFDLFCRGHERLSANYNALFARGELSQSVGSFGQTSKVSRLCFYFHRPFLLNDFCLNKRAIRKYSTGIRPRFSKCYPKS